MVSQILTGCIGHIPRLGGPETGTVSALHSLVENCAGALAGTSPIGTWLWADANQAEKAVLWDLATTPAASKTAEGAFQDNPDSIKGARGSLPAGQVGKVHPQKRRREGGIVARIR